MALLTLGDFVAGLRRGFCSYPHKQVKITKNIPEKNLIDRGDGVKEYVNLDPYVPDDNDPNPDQNDPDWDIIKGYCLRNDFHKTCASQPLFFWCSQKYMNLLIAYEEIVNRYCSNLGIQRTCNSPLFINSLGGAFITANTNSVSFVKFIEITGVPRFTFYISRYMFINFKWCQMDEIKRVEASYAAAHTVQTAAKQYLSNKTKQYLSAISNFSYAEDLNLERDSHRLGLDNNRNIRVSSQQVERFDAVDKVVYRNDLDEYLNISKAKEDKIKATKNKVITEKTKSSLIETIVRAFQKNISVSKLGNVTSRLLGSAGKINARNKSIILRMIDIVEEDDAECVKHLKDNLLEYCTLLSFDGAKGSVTAGELRKIELSWTSKLCKVLQNLTRNKPIGNSKIIMLLHELSIETGSYKYTFGNESLEVQVKNWIPWTAPTDTVKGQFVNLKDVLQEPSTSQTSHPSKLSQENYSENQDETLSVLSMETGLKSVDQDFDIENPILSLPKSPFKNIVRVGGEHNIISDSSIEVATIQTVRKRVKVNSRGNIAFTDPMRRSLLKLYCLVADNPLVTTRAAMINQSEKIWNNHSIDIKGDLVRINQIANSPATLGDIVWRRGKGGCAKGLKHCIFEVSCILYKG